MDIGFWILKQFLCKQMQMKMKIEEGGLYEKYNNYF